MIKYPVKTSSPRPFELNVVDANEEYICSVNSKENGDLIVITLNAMNEFPRFNHPRYFDEIVKWIKTHIEVNHTYNVEINIRG